MWRRCRDDKDHLQIVGIWRAPSKGLGCNIKAQVLRESTGKDHAHRKKLG